MPKFRRSVALAVGTVLLLSSAGASAQPTPIPTDDTIAMPSDHLRLITGPGLLLAPNGQRIVLPIGTHILDGVAWDRSDAEFRRLQDQETRLSAENRSLRQSASGWQPGWYTLGLTLATGIAVGWYVESHLH